MQGHVVETGMLADSAREGETGVEAAETDFSGKDYSLDMAGYAFTGAGGHLGPVLCTATGRLEDFHLFGGKIPVCHLL